MLLKIIITLLALVSCSLADLLISSISLANDTISQITSYNFQIVRFGTFSPIPSGTVIQISFPNAYTSISISSCSPVGWVGATTITCQYNSLKLRITDGFTSNSTIQNFGILVNGIQNPPAAKVYSSFSVRLIYTNNTSENSSSSYSVTITTATASCNMVLNSGLVFGQGVLTINYQSQYINSSSVGYTMKLSMLQSYPSDPTNTDINPILSVSNNMLSTYLFQFAFTNSFNISMMMPPSTQPQPNFIFIISSNILGDYDKCYITIAGVLPNDFIMLSFIQQPVQSYGNLIIKFQTGTPLLPTDLIRINFQGTSFDVSGVSNYATFTNGATGQKQVTKTGQILTIRNIASYVIVSQVNFYLQNVGFPYNSKTQSVTVFIQTDNGYLRDLQSFAYSSTPGTFQNFNFTCLTTQIGYTTSCSFSIVLSKQINDTSYIQIKFPTGFTILNGYMQCTTNGQNLNTVANCNSFRITNTIQVSQIMSGPAVIQPNSTIQITIPSITIPTNPSIYAISVSTHTQDGYTIDVGSTSLQVIPRVLRSGQISISSTSQITSTSTTYQINLALPLSLGIPYNMYLYIPFKNITTPTVNNNLLTSIYNTGSKIITILNVGNAQLSITGFMTYQSTKPITLNGNLTYNNITYFYFPGYDVACTLPRQISVFDIVQSNYVVGMTFRADIIISDISINDVLVFPTAFYSTTQTNCSFNSQCNSIGQVTILIPNNYVNNLTSISVNLINSLYVSSRSFNVSVYSQGGVFIKQTKSITIRTQVPNVLSISAIQSYPYYLQTSVYTFNILMTTAAPVQSSNNLLQVSIPSQYSILDWSCIFGCTAPQPPPISGTLYFSISSTNVSLNIKLRNPVSFTSPILMTSSSLGSMDYGSYLPAAICNMPCRSCSATNVSNCLTCYLWSSENKLRNGTCVSNCSVGQYYENSSVSCQPCNSYCLSCVNSSTTCYTCKPQFLYLQMACLTQCPLGFYALDGNCEACQINCLSCTSLRNCTLCSNSTFLYQASCWNSCRQGTYQNPLFNQCIDCDSNCVQCDATGCQVCQNSYYLYNKRCYLQCPNGLFKSVNTCSPCQNPCATCSIYSTNCTSCVTNVSNTFYYYLTNRCYQSQCPDTYYISPLDNSCLACQPPCRTCNRTQCLTCLTGLYYYRGFCSDQCQDGTYANVTNLTCLNCPTQCSTCFSETTCLSCLTPYSLYNSACVIQCPIGYFKDQNTCRICQIPCLSCSSAVVCQSCLTLSYFNGSCMISCPVGFYSNSVSVLNQTVKQCASCVLPCLTCNSATYCLSCTANLKLLGSVCQSSCPDQYYDSNGICFACSYPCNTCNITGCITCANSSLYLQRQQCLSNCTDLYPNNQTMKCQACRYPCSTCSWSNTCLSCITPFIYYQGQCVSSCPTGKYSLNQICTSCPILCSTCYLVNDQIRCPTCVNNNYFYGFSCVSACPQNSSLSDPYCVSQSCNLLTNCTTCSNMRCLECQTNFTLNSTTGKCEVITVNQTIIASISQIPVPFPFLIATVLIIICAFLIRFQFVKMYTPLFIYSFVGIAECGLIALWLALLYTRTISNNPSGAILKIIATAISGVYVLFNFIGFIVYLKVTRKDKKYKTWQKQDNKCPSVVVSIISLIVSFRFSLLKYSKLGHLQKFSATLDHDSKLSHENMLAYFSIAFISMPLIVTAAWIAYLQTSLNYLFFTCVEVTVLSVIMIILSIVQSLSPKGYTLQKKQQFKQGHDIDSIDGQSLSEMMAKLGVIQEQYHQNKEVISEQQYVGRKNITHYDQNQDNITSEALVFTKAEDEKMSIQSDIHDSEIQSNYESNIESKTKSLPVPDQKQQIQQLQSILLQAQQRAVLLNRPSRPIGMIKRQSLIQVQYRDSQSQDIESEDEPPPLSIQNRTPRKKGDKSERALKKDQQLDLNDLRTFLDIQQRRLGMRRLQQLAQHLKMQQKQELELKQRLEKITQQQKKLKHQQYERARQIVQMNQMNLQDKLSKVHKLMENRVKNQRQRKQKIIRLQQNRRKQNQQRKNKNESKNKKLIYPINQEIIDEGVDQNLKKSDHKVPIQITVQNDSKWNNENQQHLDFQQNNKWQFAKQKQSPSILKREQKSQYQQAHQDQAMPFQYIEVDHWPIDQQIQQKIAKAQSKAQLYIKRPKKQKMAIVQQYKNIQLQSDSGNATKNKSSQIYNAQKFTFQQEEKSDDDSVKLQIDETIQIPKKRVNRNVIDLSPNNKK